MARRFSFISNAKFNPFTFDEMAKPLLMYKEYYDKNEALATELAEKANEWEAKANAEQDGAAYEQVKKYADDLRGQAERLVKYGMSPGLRADLQTMKARYKGEVTPVEEAYNLRNKLAEEQRLASLKDPSLRFSKDYATASLADLLNNPTASYNQWSLNDTYNRSAAEMKALMAKSQQIPRLVRTAGGQQIWQYDSGYNQSDIIDAVRNTGNPTNVVLAEHVQNLRRQYGYANMDDHQKEEFDNTLIGSMQAGLEEHTYKVTSDPTYKKPLSEEEKRELEYKEKKAEYDYLTAMAKWQATAGKGQNSTASGSTLRDFDNGFYYDKVAAGVYQGHSSDGSTVPVDKNGYPLNVMDNSAYTRNLPEDMQNELSRRRANKGAQVVNYFEADPDKIRVLNKEEEDLEFKRFLGKPENLKNLTVWNTDLKDKSGKEIKDSDGKTLKVGNLTPTEKYQLQSYLEDVNEKTKKHLTISDVTVVKYTVPGILTNTTKIKIIPKTANLFGAEDYDYILDTSENSTTIPKNENSEAPTPTTVPVNTDTTPTVPAPTEPPKVSSDSVKKEAPIKREAPKVPKDTATAEQVADKKAELLKKKLKEKQNKNNNSK